MLHQQTIFILEMKILTLSIAIATETLNYFISHQTFKAVAVK